MSKRKITKTERRKAAIVAFLENNPGAQRGAIMDGARGLSSVNKQIVTNTLGALRKAGSIRREGSRKSTRWFVESPDEPKEVEVVEEPVERGLVYQSVQDSVIAIATHAANLVDMMELARAGARIADDAHKSLRAAHESLRAAMRNFLDGKTTVADLRKALGEDE